MVCIQPALCAAAGILVADSVVCILNDCYIYSNNSPTSSSRHPCIRAALGACAQKKVKAAWLVGIDLYIMYTYV